MCVSVCVCVYTVWGMRASGTERYEPGPVQKCMPRTRKPEHDHDMTRMGNSMSQEHHDARYMARTWQEHCKSMATAWQEHGKSMARTWHGEGTLNPKP